MEQHCLCVWPSSTAARTAKKFTYLAIASLPVGGRSLGNSWGTSLCREIRAGKLEYGHIFPPVTINGVTCTMLRLQNNVATEGMVTKEKTLIFKPLLLISLPLESSSAISVLSYVSTYLAPYLLLSLQKENKHASIHSYSQLFLRGRSGGGWQTSITVSFPVLLFFFSLSRCLLCTHRKERQNRTKPLGTFSWVMGVPEVFLPSILTLKSEKGESLYKGLWFTLPLICFLSL